MHDTLALIDVYSSTACKTVTFPGGDGMVLEVGGGYSR